MKSNRLTICESGDQHVNFDWSTQPQYSAVTKNSVAKGRQCPASYNSWDRNETNSISMQPILFKDSGHCPPGPIAQENTCANIPKRE